MDVVTRFLLDERGADLIEYALLVGMLSLAAIAGVGGVGDSMTRLFQALQARITAAGTAP